jgi:drug/metabolite transporter (DMT)-like permease
MAYYLYNLGIKRIGPSRASAFLNLIPVIAAVSAFFILGEPLGITKMLGIAVAICGLFLSQRRTKTYPAVLPPG